MSMLGYIALAVLYLISDEITGEKQIHLTVGTWNIPCLRF